MKCQNCEGIAVISTDNGTFCRKHFIQRFEEIVIKTIKENSLIKTGERIGVANSGGKDSLSLLLVLVKHFGKDNLVSITIDEGIRGYRDKTIKTMKRFCTAWGVEYNIYSYKDFSNFDMDSITKIKSGIPCATCGVFRRHLLNVAAIANHVDKLATAHNLDDEAENVLMNLFQNDFDRLIRLGPESGIISDPNFVPRIKPFMFVSEKETMLYSILNGIDAIHTPCPYAGAGFRGIISKKVKELETIRRGAKRALAARMLDIKEKLGRTVPRRTLLHCVSCGMPSSDEYCEACSIKRELSALSTV